MLLLFAAAGEHIVRYVDYKCCRSPLQSGNCEHQHESQCRPGNLAQCQASGQHYHAVEQRSPTCNSKLIVEHRVLSPRLVLIPTEPHWLLLMRPLLLVQLSCC